MDLYSSKLCLQTNVEHSTISILFECRLIGKNNTKTPGSHATRIANHPCDRTVVDTIIDTKNGNRHESIPHHATPLTERNLYAHHQYQQVVNAICNKDPTVYKGPV